MKYIHLPTVFASILGSALMVTLFLGFNYLQAQWSGAPSNPPSGNIAAPIHTGGGNQMSAAGPVPVGGDTPDRISTGQFLASDRMLSDRYCDVRGENCFEPGDVGGSQTGISVSEHFVQIRGPETGAKDETIGQHDFCSLAQNMTFDNGGASGGPEEGCRVSQQANGEWNLRARRNGGADSDTATMCAAMCFTLNNSGDTTGGAGSSCAASVEYLPSTSDTFFGCEYSLPARDHNQVVSNSGDRGFTSTFQCNDGDWEVVSNNCSFQPRCFAAGTQVTMADGSTKNIEDIEIGEVLLGADGAHNEVLDFERPRLGERKLYSINGGPYFVTPAHPLRTTDGWKSISMEEIHRENTELVAELAITKLQVGDELIKADGTTEIVQSIDGRAEEDQELYNFILSGDRTYYVNGILTHNEFSAEEY